MVCYVAQEGSEEGISEEKEEEFAMKKDAQVLAEEKLEEINLGFNLQELRPILISSRLSEKVKLELISLLEEFKDVFTWN